jgi:hypothetical protein
MRRKVGYVSNLQEIPTILSTDEAAKCLNRKPRTLHKWSCLGNGPIQPVRVNGRLGWRLTDIQKLLSGTATDLASARP